MSDDDDDGDVEMEEVQRYFSQSSSQRGSVDWLQHAQRAPPMRVDPIPHPLWARPPPSAEPSLLADPLGTPPPPPIPMATTPPAPIPLGGRPHVVSAWSHGFVCAG